MYNIQVVGGDEIAHTAPTFEDAVEWIQEYNDFASYEDDVHEEFFDIIEDGEIISTIK